MCGCKPESDTTGKWRLRIKPCGHTQWGTKEQYETVLKMRSKDVNEYLNVLETELGEDKYETIETRTTSVTGGMKGVKAERFSLIPKAPLDLLGRIYGYGHGKYGDAHNYRKGYEWSKSYDALQRHLTAWWEREETDPESELSHLGHAAWHIFTLIVFSSNPQYSQYDDRYFASSDEPFPFVELTDTNESNECRWETMSRSDDLAAHVCAVHGKAVYGLLPLSCLNGARTTVAKECNFTQSWWSGEGYHHQCETHGLTARNSVDTAPKTCS